MSTINLDSQTETSKQRTTAVGTDSILTCSNTSAPDVYVAGIIDNKLEHQLHAGESMAVPKMTTLRVQLFRVDPGNALFSTSLDLSAVPASAPDTKSKVASKRAPPKARSKSR